MSGESDGPAYEIERRTKGHITPPQGFEKAKTYNPIKDTYVSLEPRIRVRKALRTYPPPEKDESPETGTITIKEILEPGNSEVFETQASVGESKGKPEFAINAFRRFSGLNCVIRGCRETYKKGKVEWCLDHVEGQGDWTEVEIMVHDPSKISDAVKDIVSMFEGQGVKKYEIKERDYVDNWTARYIVELAKLNREDPPTRQMLEKTLVMKDDSPYLKRMLQVLKERGFLMLNGDEVEYLKDFNLSEF